MTQLLQVLATDLDKDFISKVRQNPDKVYFPNFGSGDNILSEGFSIDRVMFTIPGINFKVYWYGFLIAVGILLAMFYGYKRMKDVGVDPDRATDGIIAGFVGAIFGARLYYIMFNSDYSMSQFFNIRDGGLAIYGGIIGAIVVGGIVVKLRKVNLTALLDIVGPCFLIGQAIGRWGNFFNQEAFGSNTDLPWGMMSNKTIVYIADHFDDLGGEVSSYAPVHPCFLYESLWCLAAFIFLHFYLRHRKFDGEVFLMYIGLYGLGRFFIESTRTDSLYLMNIKVSQLVAGACVVASLILIIVFRNIVKRNDDYKLYVDTKLSKAQMEEYNTYAEVQKAKKEMKKKIKAAKASGEDTTELEKEFEEKFGKKAKKESEKIKEEESSEEDSDSESKYTSILGDEEEESEPETGDEEASDEEENNDITNEEENSDGQDN